MRVLEGLQLSIFIVITIIANKKKIMRATVEY